MATDRTHGELRQGGTRHRLNAAAARHLRARGATDHDAAFDDLLAAQRSAAADVLGAHIEAARTVAGNVHEVAILSEHGGVSFYDATGKLVDRVEAPGTRTLATDRSPEHRTLFWSRPQSRTPPRSRTPIRPVAKLGATCRLRVVNRLPLVPIRVSFLDANGRARRYITIRSGGAEAVDTHVGAAFRITDEAFGEELCVYCVPGETASPTLTVPAPRAEAHRCTASLLNGSPMPFVTELVPTRGPGRQLPVPMGAVVSVTGREGDVALIRSGDSGALRDVRVLRRGVGKWMTPRAPRESVNQGSQTVRLIVANLTGEPLHAYRVDDRGRRTKQWVLTPLVPVSLPQRSRPGELWRFEDPHGHVLRVYEMGRERSQTLEVERRSAGGWKVNPAPLHGYLGDRSTWFDEPGFTEEPPGLAADPVEERLFALAPDGELWTANYRGRAARRLTAVPKVPGEAEFRLAWDAEAKVLFAASNRRILRLEAPHTSVGVWASGMNAEEPALVAVDGVRGEIYYSADRRSIERHGGGTIYLGNGRIGGLAMDAARNTLYWIESETTVWRLQLDGDAQAERVFQVGHTGKCHDLALLTEVGGAQQELLDAMEERRLAAEEGEALVQAATTEAAAAVQEAYEALAQAETDAAALVANAAEQARRARQESHIHMLEGLAGAAASESAARAERVAQLHGALADMERMRHEALAEAAAKRAAAHAELVKAHRELHG